MKTVNYSLSNSDKQKLKSDIKKHGIPKALFNLFVNDGLANITKEADEYYTFEDHAGECFCPIVNTEISPAELKRQEKKERARFNRKGCFAMTLYILGNEVGSIGGFVGNDFYGSGYDNDFYNQAYEILKTDGLTSEYVKSAMAFIMSEIDGVK